MQVLRATAPGKAVLCGEYVVLHDVPAIAVAVDRRARVAVTGSTTGFHVIDAPGYLPGEWSFTQGDDGELTWQEALSEPSAFSLVEAIWKTFDDAEWPPLSIEIDTRELCDAATGLKLGLGSSAAVAVALTAALKRYCDVACDARERAFDAHDSFQRHRGSGIDVAASHDGGLILYRRAGRASRRLGWPAGLHYRFLWSGQAADTSGKLASLADGGVRQTHSDALAGLADQAEEVAAAWALGDARTVLDAYPAYVDALRRFGAVHDLGIFDAGHDDLARTAMKDNVVYKPCGAGGGDIGIVLGACEHDVTEFCNRAGRPEFRILDLAVEEQGVLFAE